jgi:TolA-binding protein
MLTKKKGQVLVSGLSGDGYDIQMLGKDSNSVSPPHHLNFISIEGFEIMFKKAGFDKIDIITPGMLDFDIVKNAMNSENFFLYNNGFAKLISKRGEQAEKDFQRFLQKHKLSSHVWIFARHS